MVHGHILTPHYINIIIISRGRMYAICSDERFVASYRMPRADFDELYGVVSRIYFETYAREDVPRQIDVKLLFAAFINQLAFGKRFNELEEHFGCSRAWLHDQRPLIWRCIGLAIQQDDRAAIRFPRTEHEWRAEMRAWYSGPKIEDNRYQFFYGAAGAIDGTLIEVELRQTGQNDQDKQANKANW
jgi:hypothetical protein